MTTTDITARNRIGWDAIAPARPPRPAGFFRAGGTTLDEPEREALGDVTGTRVLHLQCANGNETLSLAAAGAEATGVDISAVAVGMARDTAAEAGLAARFVVADVYALPDGLTGFDLVYASSGAVCWLPDLTTWARIVADRLRPGGRFVLWEHHPVWETLAVSPEGALSVDGDYFARHRPARRTDDAVRRPTGDPGDTDLVSFVWPVADVVTALLTAGLRLDRYEEHPVPAMYPGLGAAGGALPAVYLLVATKET